jgi:hypothetical protein
MQIKLMLMEWGLSAKDADLIQFMFENSDKFALKVDKAKEWKGLTKNYEKWVLDTYGRKYQKPINFIDIRLDKVGNLRVTPYSKCINEGTEKHGFYIQRNGLVKAYKMIVPFVDKATKANPSRKPAFEDLGMILDLN